MPPSKRSLQKKEKEKIITQKIYYCRDCVNKGDEIYQLVYICKANVNKPYGNHSLLFCPKYEKIEKPTIGSELIVG